MRRGTRSARRTARRNSLAKSDAVTSPSESDVRALRPSLLASRMSVMSRRGTLMMQRRRGVAEPSRSATRGARRCRSARTSRGRTAAARRRWSSRWSTPPTRSSPRTSTSSSTAASKRARSSAVETRPVAAVTVVGGVLAARGLAGCDRRGRAPPGAAAPPRRRGGGRRRRTRSLAARRCGPGRGRAPNRACRAGRRCLRRPCGGTAGRRSRPTTLVSAA